MTVKDDPHVVRSVEWLEKIQNLDGGWGMYDHEGSRILTTAEAVTALAIAEVKGKVINDGINYLVASGKNPNWCQYTRHHAWIIYALNRARQSDRIPDRCFQYLQRSHIKGVWSQTSRGHPDVFATFLALRALYASQKSERILKQSRQWIYEQAKSSYWTFGDNHPSYAATSYSILALTTQQNWSNSPYNDQIEKGVNFLREGTELIWPVEHTPRVSGDLLYNFHHCSISWVIMALLATKVSPSDPVILRTIDYLYNNLYCDFTGGWSEEAEHRPSVFATSHAIAALEMFYNKISVDDYLSYQGERQRTMSHSKNHTNNVFVVHGHDKSAKYEVTHFLDRIGCNAIILDEQVDSGLTTIFQKLTNHSENVSYAIVLLTPDDVAEDGSGKRASRARQNVILELGWFIGKLGAEKVCLAKRGDIEIPTDISGILYLNLDDSGWKLLLMQKLMKAGFSIDPIKLSE